MLAIGELLVDAITSVQVTDLSQARYLNIHPGGSTANFCRYLSRCGTTARLAAAVGDDGFGKILLEKMASDGISAAHITVTPHHNTSLIVVGRNSYTPDFIPYRDADRHIPPVPPALVSGASLVHTTAFSLSSEPARSVIMQAFTQAYREGITVSADWNFSEKIWQSRRQAEELFASLQELEPLLKFSMDDVRRFAGRELNLQEAMDYLHPVRAKLLCLTCGAEGVFYKPANGNWQFAPVVKISVENATGAGDAFWAGFIHGWNMGMQPAEAVQHGIDTSTLKLQGKLAKTS